MIAFIGCVAFSQLVYGIESFIIYQMVCAAESGSARHTHVEGE